MSGAAFFRIKKLTGAGIIKVAASHNRRTIAAEIGAAGHIDASRCHLNVTLEGESTPQAVADMAQSLMRAAGTPTLRRDAVRAIEAVFSLPVGAAVDHANYFKNCTEWAREKFGPVLSADAHHDEAAPHLHVLCLPLVNGRMVGSDLVGGPSKLRQMQTEFHTQVAAAFGLRRGATRQSKTARASAAAGILAYLNVVADPALKSALWSAIRDAIERDPGRFAESLGFERNKESASKRARVRTFTNIMTSTGKGAKSLNEERRRDRILLKANPIGFGSGDASDEQANPRTL